MTADENSREILMQQVLDRLDEMKSVPQDVAVIRQQMDQVVDAVGKNSRTLRGENGDGGMLGSITRIEECQKNDHNKVMQLDYVNKQF